MAERKYYTAPDVAERAIRGCWPELNFRLGEQIGHGGMSDVYKLAAGGRVEALKVTNSAARADTPELFEDLCWRGANELEYARRMSEAGCGVKVYDTAEFALSDSDRNRRLFLIRMEYLQSLPKYLEQLQEAERTATVLAALESVAKAIQKMEKEKTLHRDIKPENILVKNCGASPEFFLTDFGLARPNYLESKMDNFSISGTGCYRAPELLEGREIVGNKSDIYSLGVSLYKLLVHKGKKRLQFDPLIFARQVDQYKDVPDDILEVILALTKNDPQERLSPQKVATALHRALLVHDKERYAAALKTALYALRGRCANANELVNSLPRGAAATLLAAAAALQHKDAKTAQQLLAGSDHPACWFYLAGVIPEQAQSLLERAARAGYAPARAALLGLPRNPQKQLAALRAALQQL
ncbi:protein kinase [Faecalibacterium sp. I3-3-33]|uniref:protein kinase domain-containing protein n=1 Tax=Faecalibacterium sp. I3-3-33 TaxID=2929492 RepID=UPI002014D2C0|nr:protein kinase [Faecalibacterium sp. I3-3-33]UQK46229.1 protein kinase [Faecalibacterium sp. I3-3-33]